MNHSEINFTNKYPIGNIIINIDKALNKSYSKLKYPNTPIITNKNSIIYSISSIFQNNVLEKENNYKFRNTKYNYLRILNSHIKNSYFFSNTNKNNEQISLKKYLKSTALFSKTNTHCTEKKSGSALSSKKNQVIYKENKVLSSKNNIFYFLSVFFYTYKTTVLSIIDYLFMSTMYTIYCIQCIQKTTLLKKEVVL